MASPTKNMNQLTTADIVPGAIIVNPENNRQYRVDRLEGDQVHCVLVSDTSKKQTFEVPELLKHWRLSQRIAA